MWQLATPLIQPGGDGAIRPVSSSPFVRFIMDWSMAGHSFTSETITRLQRFFTGFERQEDECHEKTQFVKEA